MKKEFGKWLMDIAKYVVTGVIIASLLVDSEAWFIYAGGGVLATLCLAFGLYFVNDDKKGGTQ
jgi:hypothetical protein